MKTKILLIHKSLKDIPPFELAKHGVLLLVKNLEANGAMTEIDKLKLAHLFSDRLLDKPRYDQTS